MVDVSISVVIVNYNAGDLLLQCIESVLFQTDQVLVVDNASLDKSLAVVVARYPAEPKLQIIRNNTNLGFAAACNIGGELAKGQFVLYLNPDCRIDATAVSTLRQVLELDASVGMVGGLLINPDGTEQRGGRRAVPTPGRSLAQALGIGALAHRYPRLFSDFMLHQQPLPDHPIEVEAISGACMMVRREALESVGPLDEGYFMHCEDLDWCMRFQQKGWKILFVPDAKVMHYKGTCSKGRPIFVEWHKHKGMIRFYQKFFRDHYPLPLSWLVVAGVWARLGVMAGYYSLRHATRWLRGR